MTINSETRVAGPFDGNDSTVSFPFTFKVFDSDEVRVVAETGAVETDLKLGTDYTVTLNADQNAAPGGSVVLAAPLATGTRLTLTSALEMLQPVDLTNQGGFYPRVINSALDRLTILLQQLASVVSRTLKFPLSDGPVGDLPGRSARAGTVLAFDEATGEPVAGPDIASVNGVAGALVAVNTVADNIVDVNTVADNIVDVNTVGQSIANVNTVAGNIADVNTVAGNIADVNTVADNVADLSNFAGVYYGPSATDPTTRRDGSPLQVGDLYFYTVTNALRTYNGSAWRESVSGAVTVQNLSGDGVQTQFPLDYAPDSEAVTDVFVNGVYQQKNTYALGGANGDVLIFNQAPPAGTNNIEVVVSSLIPSDDKLRQDLASPTGAGLVARGASSVDADLTSLEGRATTLESRADDVEGALSVAPGRLAALVGEAQANRLIRFDTGPFRIVSKAAYDAVYDHFGVMDLTPKGDLILLFRRGSVHTGGSDGVIAFRKLLPSGSWGPVTTVAEQAGLDFRAAAGGVMPSGRIIVSGTIWTTGDLYVYASDDYGDTWTLKQMVPKGAADYRLAYGRAIQVGDKFVLPFYSKVGANYELRWLETTDGGDTWVEGATIYSGAVEYNEADYVNLGGGAVLGVSRIASGTGGKLRQFLSTDGGATWSNQGDVTAQNGDATDVLVSPSLSLITSESGTQHVVLFYTNRTTQNCFYRTIPVKAAVAGPTGWSDRFSVYSAPADSGYQSQVVIGGRVLGTLYRELSSTRAGAYQFEAYLGALPDYESQWTEVAASTLYTFAHGLQRAPRRVVVEFATSTNPSVWFTVGAAYYNDGANKGSGAQVEIGATNIRVGTGASVWGTGYFAGIDFAAGNRLASGFYRVRAWI